MWQQLFSKVAIGLEMLLRCVRECSFRNRKENWVFFGGLRGPNGGVAADRCSHLFVFRLLLFKKKKEKKMTGQFTLTIPMVCTYYVNHPYFETNYTDKSYSLFFYINL